MADGMTPAAEAAGTLYERDFHAWTQAQAEALRSAGGDAALDYENLAEEIESLGRSDVREVRSRVGSIIEHLLKLETSSSVEPRAGWRATVVRARSDLDLVLADSPSLRRRAGDIVAEEMKRTGQLVIRLLRQHDEDPSGVQARLDAGGYTEEQVLGDWWPDTPPPTAGPTPFP